MNPVTGNDERYFRLKESFRDAAGIVCNSTILTVGFDMNELPMEDVRQVAVGLTELYDNPNKRGTLFGDMIESYPPHIRHYILKYWQQIVDKGKLDVVQKAKEDSRKKAERKCFI